MSTNKIALRSVEEFMSDYTPIYQPIYPLFAGKSQAYPEEVGKLDFRRIATVGDIRAKNITPKDTEIRQIAVADAKKSFRKYFLANQFQISQVQNREGVEEVVTQVLDEHQKQMDDLFLLGEGTSNSTMLNNGLFWSNDENYDLESSVEVQKDTNGDHLADLYSQVMTSAQKADQVAGRKAVIFYGTTLLPQYNGLFATASRPFKSVLAEGLGSNYSLVQMPASPTPSGTNGWIVANLDQVKLHYTTFPKLLAQGNNEEKMYLWFNFMMGSCMLEVLAQNAIIRQPATLEA